MSIVAWVMGLSIIEGYRASIFEIQFTIFYLTENYLTRQNLRWLASKKNMFIYFDTSYPLRQLT